VTRATDRMIQYWDSPEMIAGHDQHPSGFDAERRAAAWRAEFARVLPPPPARVLDLGCGTGWVSLLLAGMGYTVRGVDLGENRLAFARAKAREQHVEVSFEKGDAHDPPGEPGSVDAITSRNLFWTLEDPAAALHSARRLLRPGGTLVVIDGDWFRNGWDPDQYREYPWYQTWVDCYAGLVGGLPLFDLQGPQDVQRFVVGAGFTDVEAGRLEFVERLPEDTPTEGRYFIVTATNPGPLR
jgi:SAM-dependent methyltransferase